MKIGVWYHCVLNGPHIPSEDNAILIMADQMKALKESGLASAADQIHIGINGGEDEKFLVQAAAPDKSQFYLNPDGQSELSTMRMMREWLTPGWAVLYHHIKGVQHLDPRAHYHQWRRNLEWICVRRWQECVMALEQGFDTAGTQWSVALPASTYPPGQRYWKGNFWWARSEYLLGLQPLVEIQFQNRTEFENRYEAEVWIGKCNGEPRVKNIL